MSLTPQYAPASAAALGLKINVATASNEGEIEDAFESFAKHHADAVVVGADGYFTLRRDQIIGLAARHTLPAIYNLREYPEGGGLRRPIGSDEYWLGRVKLFEHFERRTNQFVGTSTSGMLMPISR